MGDARKLVFDAIRAAKGSITSAEVALIDYLCDQLGIPRSSKRRVSTEGIALMHRWEGCARKRTDGRYEAYPDPGSVDGHPWTIGWGSTGPRIGAGTVWSRQQCDDRFANDLIAYADEVAEAIGGAQTSQSQFDALVSFHYNTGEIASATLTKRHVAGDSAGAKAEFGKWVKNDGKVMRGLVNRRAAEAAMYGSAA